MEGQETSDLDPHQGKLQNHLAFFTHLDVRRFKGQIRVLKVTYGNYCMFLGMILETSKVKKWSMGSKESVEE